MSTFPDVHRVVLLNIMDLFITLWHLFILSLLLRIYIAHPEPSENLFVYKVVGLLIRWCYYLVAMVFQSD